MSAREKRDREVPREVPEWMRAGGKIEKGTEET